MRSALLRTTGRRVLRSPTVGRAAHSRFNSSSGKQSEANTVTEKGSTPSTSDLLFKNSSQADQQTSSRNESVPGDHTPQWHGKSRVTTRPSHEPQEEPEDPSQRVIDHPAASIVLRDACKCSRCKDPSTGQREFHIANIPTDIKATFAEQDARGNWIIKWANDMPGWEDHVSTFTPQEIDRLKTYTRREHYISAKLWDKKDYEKDRFTVTYDEYMSSDTALAKTLYYFVRHGLVMIRDVPEDEGSVAKLAQRIAAVKSTFYGETWDVKSVPNAINVAYTSKYLGFHADLMYIKEPPTAQFLHCIHNSCIGGESRFVDQLKALDILMFEHPRLASDLIRTRLRYEYENNGNYYTDIKSIVQMRGDTFTFPRRRFEGAINHKLWYVYRIFWSPPFLGSIMTDYGGEAITMKRSLAAMKKYAEILERNDLVFEEKMIPGTCVLFDNLRVLHARNAFDMNTGKRWLRGAYLDGQDMWSKEIKFKDLMDDFEQTTSPNPRTQSGRRRPF